MAKKKNDVETIPSAQEGDLGRLLVELRESVGYSIPQTADAMCLSEEVLLKLEAEDFKALPEPPYIRGYLRNYAKIAETEADELITCYESLRGADPSDLNYHFKSSSSTRILSQQKKGMSPVLMQLVFLAILLGGLVALSMIPAVNQWIKTTWDSFSAQTSAQSADNPLLTGTMPVPTPLPGDIAQAESKPAVTTDPAAASTTTDNQATKPESTDTQKLVADTSPSDKTEKTSDSNTDSSKENNNEAIKVGEENKNEALIPASSDGTINIKLVFNKEVWMRIKDGNKKTVFEGQNASGQEKELKLKKPLTFRVGNAQGLSLFVDGSAVDISSYIKGSIANFTLE